MTLAAAELGLGTCWVGNFNRGKAVELLGLPDSFEPVAFTPLGRPAAAPNWKKRKEAGEIVHWEFYGGKQ
jgi:nitroreductase